MSTAKLAKMLENTEDWDPITPQVIQSIFKNDSRAMQSLGDRMNWDALSSEARYNQQNPEEGIANASKATGMGFLGAWLGGLAGGAGGANAGYVDQIGNAYEGALAGTQTSGGLLGGAAGQYGTMESALADTGYTPSTLRYALQNANAENGTGLMSNMQNYGKGLMDRASSPGYRRAATKKFVMNQAQDMMTPQEPAQAPESRFQQQEQPQMPIYLTEEEKRRLREQGYSIY